MCTLHSEYIIGAVVLFIAAYFVQMGAWALIMDALNFPLSANEILKGYTLSSLARYIPGTIWGFLSRNEWLAQTHNIAYGVSNVASLVEAAMLMGVAVTLGALYWAQGFWKLPVAGLGIIGIGVAWIAVPWVAYRFGGRWLHVSQVHFQKWGVGVLAGLCYLLLWILQGGAIVSLGATLCMNSNISWIAGIASITWASTLGFITPFVPAGLGVREWGLSALLVMFSGLEPGQATLLAVLSRIAMICAEVVVVCIGLQSRIQSHLQGRRVKGG